MSEIRQLNSWNVVSSDTPITETDPMRYAAILVFAGLLQSATLGAQTRELSSSGALLDRIAAIVNEGVVLQSEVDRQTELVMKRLAEQNQNVRWREVRKQVLERLIVNQIQLQRAERLGIRVSDEMLNAALARVAQANNIPFARLPEVLASEGVDYGIYREQMRKEMIIEQLTQRDVVRRINVTEREIGKFLIEQADALAGTSEYDVSHILLSLPAGATPEEVERVSARANGIYKQLADGADFAQLAISHSDSQTALEGGSLGWRKGVELPTVFADLIPEMSPGDVSEPFRTQSGYNLIRLNGVRGGSDQQVIQDQYKARHILVSTTEILDDQAARQKLVEVQARIEAGEDFSALAQAMSEDLGSASRGGDIGWVSPGMLVPEFDQAAAEMEKDEMRIVKSQYGWHLIQLLDRRKENVTEQLKRNRAFLAIRNSKMEEETELWLRQLRDDAYVEYRL